MAQEWDRRMPEAGRLTDAFIQSLPGAGKTVVYREARTPGFGARVNLAGTLKLFEDRARAANLGRPLGRLGAELNSTASLNEGNENNQCSWVCFKRLWPLRDVHRPAMAVNFRRRQSHQHSL